MTRYEVLQEEEKAYNEEAKRWVYLGREDLENLYQQLANSTRTHRLELTVEEAEQEAGE